MSEASDVDMVDMLILLDRNGYMYSCKENCPIRLTLNDLERSMSLSLRFL